ncbi:anthranilate synthase component I family protein [Candidatus Peregrinibacteria bacterium]|nr:anthranilate synthase component I family protein [Candidatus Peregrinibacteria bacterium]
MIKYSETIQGIKYESASGLFSRIYKNYKHKFLFESKDISPIYGRLSLIGIDSVLKISGKNNKFEIVALNNRSRFFIDLISSKDLSIAESFVRSKNKISGTINKNLSICEETKRSQRKNISQIIRMLLRKFEAGKKTFLGLYGAFSYDFIRLFEDIPNILQDNGINDFTLFLYDTFIYFDHLKEKASLILYRKNRKIANRDASSIKRGLKNNAAKQPEYRIENAEFSLNRRGYMKMVEKAREYALKGELFEIVFSNILKADFKGNPFGLYLKYREANPSPYLFYFDLGLEQLVGASPEMMVRVEKNIVHLRPISGTIKRGADPIEDHDNMLALLSDAKEKAELDMLIDLGRNDLSRVCTPGLKINDYRFVEKYSRVMHTVAHLSGKLKKGFIALDALIACLNAGTLTGAPKVAAMTAIEQHEKSRRGYYGGTIGYLTFSGEMDTAIIIRTAHIKDNSLQFQVGATLLFNSVPQKEYEETLSKAQAFLDTFANQSQSRRAEGAQALLISCREATQYV